METHWYVKFPLHKLDYNTLILLFFFLDPHYACIKQVKSNAPKPNQRKKWRKSTIQLVPVAPPSSQPQETTDVQRKPENSTSENDIPLKLPRAMRSATSNGSNLLRERNVDQAEESVNKELSVLPQSSPARPKRATEEKENCSR